MSSVNLVEAFKNTQTISNPELAKCYDYSTDEASTITMYKQKFKTNITVVNQDTFEAAQKFDNCAVLNLASNYSPGGGVWKGSKAQEEDLCRRSNLYRSLSKKYYPFNLYTTLYSKKIIVAFDTKYQKLETPFEVDVITSAALRYPELYKDKYKPEDYKIMTNKIRCQLYIARENNVKNLILGAFGCGAFGNPPNIVSRIYKKLLSTEFDGQFENVVFAILGNNQNYDIFAKCFA